MLPLRRKFAPSRKTAFGRAWEIGWQKYHRLRREVYQRLACRASTPKRILLIVGCQRSGTTLMGNILARDLRTAVLQEQSCITGAATLRLKPYDEANRILQSLRAPFIIAKPLVESQWTPELLSAIAGSRALWMYRGYRDVVRSNVTRFHSQIQGLRGAISGQPTSWRHERVSPRTRELLVRFFREDMRREDAAALGWYSRNILYFELGLDRHDRVMLCKYEDLVIFPTRTVNSVYHFVDVEPPRNELTRDVDSQSLGLGCDVEIDARISALCDELAMKLSSAYDAQQCRSLAPRRCDIVQRADQAISGVLMA